MKLIKLNFILLYSLLILGQTQNAQVVDTIFISEDSLKAGSIDLDGLWKFKPGDDSSWAMPEFDDTDWDTIQSRVNFENFPVDNWNGIGWYRKSLRIDESLKERPLALLVEQFGASEIYLNGELVKAFGKIGKSYEEEEVYMPRSIPITMILDTNNIYTFAVRYSYQASVYKSDWIEKWYGRVGFNARVNFNNNSISQSVFDGSMNYAVNFGIAGLFFSLSILYLLLFLFYLRKKENLYYSFFTFFISLVFIISMSRRLIHSNMELSAYFNFIASTALLFIFASYLGFLYSIFYKRVPKLFWAMVAVAVIIAVMNWSYLPEDFVDYLYIGFILLTTVEGLRIIIIALRKKKDNAWVIGAGVIVFVIFILTVFTIALFGITNLSGVFGVSLFISGLLCLPISMSVYLARDIASTNKNLEIQLETVKDLSAKELDNQKRNAELTLQAEKERSESEKAKLQVQIVEAENSRKTAELEEARQLQLSMLPKTLPNLPHLDIAVYMQTATEVGGDYYDFHVSMDGTLTTVIGDATGHGLNAGTIVTITKSLFNSYASSSNILDTFQEISHGIKEMKFKYLSMCLMILKIKDYKLQLSAAGMPPALIYRKDKNIIDELLIKGMPLGAPASFPYELKNTSLNKGDTILLMSDGFPELLNEDRNMFGYDIARAKFDEVAAKNPEEIITHLKKSGAEWMDGKDPDDDVTFVVIKVK